MRTPVPHVSRVYPCLHEGRAKEGEGRCAPRRSITAGAPRCFPERGVVDVACCYRSECTVRLI